MEYEVIVSTDVVTSLTHADTYTVVVLHDVDFEVFHDVVYEIPVDHVVVYATDVILLVAHDVVYNAIFYSKLILLFILLIYYLGLQSKLHIQASGLHGS